MAKKKKEDKPKSLFGNLLNEEKMYCAETIVEDMAKTVPQRENFFSTSPSMAWSTATGFQFGAMELMYGPKSSGKTMIALDRIKSILAIDPELICVFVDAELGFEFESTVRWMKANGVDTKRVLIIREVNIKKIFETHILQKLQKAIQEDGVKIGGIIMDSIAAMGVKEMPTTLNQKNISGLAKQDHGARANYLARIFPFFREFVRDHRPYVMFINQARIKGTDFFGNTIYETNGGEALYHEVQYRYLVVKDETKPILAENTKDIKGKPVQIGQRSSWTCEKNKMAEGLGRIGYVDMIYMKGIVNTELEMVDLASKLGIMEIKGAWYYYDGESFQGAANAAKFLEENPDKYNELFGAVMMDASNTEKYLGSTIPTDISKE